MTFAFLEAAFDLVISRGDVVCLRDDLSAHCNLAVTELPPEEFKFLDSLGVDALADWVLETVPSHWRK